VNLVSFSGDKLLGGPQAGILSGDLELMARLRRNPMFRALRADKLIYAALETTLRHVLFERWEKLPAMRMISMPAGVIRDRARRLVDRCGIDAEVIPGRSVIGGGSTPDQSLGTWLIAIDGNVNELERALRLGEPAVIARLEDNRLLLDLRTVFESEEKSLGDALKHALDTNRPTC
jgi:L-seryl-tRNA(Ser) seleniumtransferase